MKLVYGIKWGGELTVPLFRTRALAEQMLNTIPRGDRVKDAQVIPVEICYTPEEVLGKGR
jgi:hypothetical protein